MKSFDLKEVQTITEYISGIDPVQLAVSPQRLYELVLQAASWKSRTGELMAIAKKDWLEAKVRAYDNYVFNEKANNERVDKYGVMVIKDYIASRCGDKEAAYEYVERCNRACSALEDAVRSVMSSLKEEMKNNMHV